MKFKMTPLERKWVWYDVGNSAFTLLVSTLIPIFFAAVAAEEEGSATVAIGYATSIATAVVAILGPILGSLSDLRGMRKLIFSVSVLAGAVGCIVLGFMQHWFWFLVLLVLSKSAYQISLVVYDSMLCDVTQRERMDEVSSRGYAWGYIGSCIPFVITVFVYVLYAMPSLFVGEGQTILSLEAAMILVFSITAVWWFACTLPLWKSYRQTNFVEPGSHPVRSGFRSLGKTFQELVTQKHILLFLIAFFFFIDGVYTIIDLAVAYGRDLGLTDTSLVLALLVTQVVAFPAAILLGMLSRKVKPQYLILVCIVAYFFITVYAVFLDQTYEFWILAVCVGLFQGTIQAMSRSYFAKIIPQKKASEYFGIYDIFGKGASFMGTFLVALVADISGRENWGVAALAVLFLLGLVVYIFAIRSKPAAESGALPGARSADTANGAAPILAEGGADALSAERDAAPASAESAEEESEN